MRRTDLQHIIRAAAAIADENEFIVIGSQTILGRYRNAPEALLQSTEADIYVRNRPELADLIEGALGELSPFENTFGYRADGVGPETARLPSEWETRLIPIQNANTNGATGWCLEGVTIQPLRNTSQDVGRTRDTSATSGATVSSNFGYSGKGSKPQR